jgi:hypothetical protein
MPIIDALIDGDYRLPLVQTAFDGLVEQANKCYPKGFDIAFSDVLNENDPEGKVPFGIVGRKTGTPIIGIFLPIVLALYQEMDRTTFESFIVISFCHELIHLGSLAETDKELTTWAETCQQVIRLYVEVYGEGIDKHDWEFYSAWIQCNGDAESDSWRSFIVQNYGAHA